MLRELLDIFRTNDPLRTMGDAFAEMFTITRKMTVSAGVMAFEGRATPEARTNIYQHDVRVNQLERSIRKKVVAHLTIPGNRADVPYCLLLMSLVKDVERLGDYAKNLSEVPDFRPEPLPDGEFTHELVEIRQGVENAYELALGVFTEANQEQAIELIRQGRDITHRCEALIVQVGRSSHDASTTTALVLTARHYKRISAHVLNILSSVVMPLHKLDYYDEDEIPNVRT